MEAEEERNDNPALNTSITSSVEDQNLGYDPREESEEDMSLFDSRAHVYRAVASEEALAKLMSSCHPKLKKSFRIPKLGKGQKTPYTHDDIVAKGLDFEDYEEKGGLYTKKDFKHESKLPNEESRRVEPPQKKKKSKKVVYTNYYTIEEEGTEQLVEELSKEELSSIHVLETHIASVNFTSNIDDAAIIDSGCARACGGQQWTEDFLKTLSDRDWSKVVTRNSDARFKFGHGQSVNSLMYMIAPVYIGGKRKYLGWDVLDIQLPLLLSLPVLKKMNFMVQYVEGKDYNLGYMKSTKFKILNSCGHQWLRLSETGSKELIMKEIDIMHAQSDAEILVTTMQPNIFTPGQEVAQVR